MIFSKINLHRGMMNRIQRQQDVSFQNKLNKLNEPKRKLGILECSKIKLSPIQKKVRRMKKGRSSIGWIFE